MYNNLELEGEIEKKIVVFLNNLGKKKDISEQQKKELLKKKKELEENKKTLKEYQDYEKTTQQTKEEKEITKKEITLLLEKKEIIIRKIKEIILKNNITKNRVIMEIRPGTGGVEAGLFVRDLYTMYAKLSDKQKWKVETLETKVDKEGNFFFVSFIINGNTAYSWLKNEAGVHRVQRIPKTESKGRIHTSTATVAVFPEPDDFNVTIQTKDIKIETFGAGGPGGQHVNKTESAVRITHLPTGISASSQDSKDQRVNKERAFLVLKTRIVEKKKEEEEEKQKNARNLMIGLGERWEKIRTYNWMQNRITDHRLNKSWSNLNFFLDGFCEEMCLELIDFEIEKKLTEIPQ